MSVYFYGCVTLDGYMADKKHTLASLQETGIAEDVGTEAFYRRMSVTLMGRRTFREIEAMGDPAAVYPTTRNYVFTHQAAPLPSGFTPVSGDVADFVKTFSPKENLWVIGGNTLLAPLLDQGLVDHLILQLAPVLLGSGIPLFTQREHLHRFRLDKTIQYGPFAELHSAKP